MNRGKAFFTSVGLAVLLLFGMAVPAHALTTLTSTPVWAVFDRIFPLRHHERRSFRNHGHHSDGRSDGVVIQEEVEVVGPGEFAVRRPGWYQSWGFYCKFTGNFNRGFVRASAQVFQLGVGTIAVAPAQAVGE